MDKRDNDLSGLAAAFLGGALVGAIAALLLAPASGKETRSRLKDYAEKTEEEVREHITGIQEAIASCHDSCREQLRKAKDAARAAVA